MTKKEEELSFLFNKMKKVSNLKSKSVSKNPNLGRPIKCQNIDKTIYFKNVTSCSKILGKNHPGSICDWISGRYKCSIDGLDNFEYLSDEEISELGEIPFIENINDIDFPISSKTCTIEEFNEFLQKNKIKSYTELVKIPKGNALYKRIRRINQQDKINYYNDPKDLIKQQNKEDNKRYLEKLEYLNKSMFEINKQNSSLNNYKDLYNILKIESSKTENRFFKELFSLLDQEDCWGILVLWIYYNALTDGRPVPNAIYYSETTKIKLFSEHGMNYLDGYELHHMKCLSCNGPNIKENLVFLSFKEHLIVHRSLYYSTSLFVNYKLQLRAAYVLMYNSHGKDHVIVEEDEIVKIMKIKLTNHNNIGDKNPMAKRIIQFSKDYSNIIKIYNCLVSTAKLFGISKDVLYKICGEYENRNRVLGGFGWKYEKDFNTYINRLIDSGETELANKLVMQYNAILNKGEDE